MQLLIILSDLVDIIQYLIHVLSLILIHKTCRHVLDKSLRVEPGQCKVELFTRKNQNHNETLLFVILSVLSLNDRIVYSEKVMIII